MAEPLLHLGDVRLVIQGVGRRGGPERMKGVLPSWADAAGRLTPRVGLDRTALDSHRWLKIADNAASFLRIVAGDRLRSSRVFRQAITCARTTNRNSSGRWMPANLLKSSRSNRYARRVRGLLMFANHSTAGATSARCRNSSALSARSRSGKATAPAPGPASDFPASCASFPVGSLSFICPALYYR